MQVRLSGLATIFAVTALGFSSGMLALALVRPPADPNPDGAVVRRGSLATVVAETRQPDAWPPVFGRLPVAAPEPEAAPEPDQPPPPVAWKDYALKGLVAVGPKRWAFIVSDDVGQLVKIGDELDDGEVVADIASEGVWLQKQGARLLVGFRKEQAVSIVALPSQPSPDGDASDAPPERVRIQDLDEEGLRQLLDEVRNRPGPGRPATQ